MIQRNNKLKRLIHTQFIFSFQTVTLNTATGIATVRHREQLCKAEGLLVDAVNIHATNMTSRFRDNNKDNDDWKFHQNQFQRRMLADHNNFVKTAYNSITRVQDWQDLYTKDPSDSDEERAIHAEQVQHVFQSKTHAYTLHWHCTHNIKTL